MEGWVIDGWIDRQTDSLCSLLLYSPVLYSNLLSSSFSHLLKVLKMRGTDDSRFKRSASGVNTASEGVGETIFDSFTRSLKAEFTALRATHRDLSTPTHTEARSLQRKASLLECPEGERKGMTKGWQNTRCSLCFREASTVPVRASRDLCMRSERPETAAEEERMLRTYDTPLAISMVLVALFSSVHIALKRKHTSMDRWRLSARFGHCSAKRM